MFIRKKDQKGKTYYSLEERWWDSGKVKTKVIAGLGQTPRAGLWELYEKGEIDKDDYIKMTENLASEPPTRKEITVKELTELRNKIDFPYFARNLVWTPEMQSSLIVSLILGYPTGDLYLYPKEDGRYLLIDGKQRLETICLYIDDKFPLESKKSEDLNRKKFSDLPKDYQACILNSEVSMRIAHRTFTEDELGEMFIRLNSHSNLGFSED